MYRHSALFFLFGCIEVPTARQSIEWISLDQTGSISVIRLTQSDTGWFKGTGHFKANLWTPNQSPLAFWDHAPTDHVIWNHALKAIGHRHQLQYGDAEWRLDSHYDEWNLRLLTTCDDLDNRWNLDENRTTIVHCIGSSHKGWSQSHDQSQMLNGQSWILSHLGQGIEDNRTLYLASTPTLRLAFEQQKESLHGTLETRPSIDKPWTTTTIHSIVTIDTGLQIQTDVGTLSITAIETIAIESPYEHIASWERTLSQSLYPTHDIIWQKGQSTWQGQPFFLLIRQHVSH